MLQIYNLQLNLNYISVLFSKYKNEYNSEKNSSDVVKSDDFFTL